MTNIADLGPKTVTILNFVINNIILLVHSEQKELKLHILFYSVIRCSLIKHNSLLAVSHTINKIFAKI